MDGGPQTVRPGPPSGEERRQEGARDTGEEEGRDERPGTRHPGAQDRIEAERAPGPVSGTRRGGDRERHHQRAERDPPRRDAPSPDAGHALWRRRGASDVSASGRAHPSGKRTTHRPSRSNQTASPSGPPGSASARTSAERVLPLVLDRTRVEVGQVVARRVVANRPVDEGQVRPRNAEPPQHGEVGVVREQPVDGREQRAPHRTRRPLGEAAGHEGAGARGLEEQARAPGAAGFQVHHRAHLACGGVEKEGLGAAQPRLLRVVDEQDHVGGGGLGAERPGDLEGDGHARAVVGGARPGGNRVEVGGDEHRWAAPAARQAGHDVRDRRAGEVAVAGQGLRDPGLNADGAELGDDPVAHPRARLRPDRVGDALSGGVEHAPQLRERPPGREGAGGGRGRKRGRGLQPEPGRGEERGEEEESGGEGAPVHRGHSATPPAPRWAPEKRRASPGERDPRASPCCDFCCFATSPRPACSAAACRARTGC